MLNKWITYSEIKRVPKIFLKTQQKFFKNKVQLSNENITIHKQSNVLKINVHSGGDLNLNKKLFLFSNNSSIESIVKKVESEYNLAFELDKDLKHKFENLMKDDISFTKIENEETNHILKLNEILKKLNIDVNQSAFFIKEVMQKSDLDCTNLKHLKILYFNIMNEIEIMDKIKKRLENSTSNRVSFYLLIVAAILIAQTAWFYHMIFNVEHLGWDLVEPTTYLVSSCIFLFGIFSYVKLHRNAISGEKFFKEITRNILLKKYVKNNFNMVKYEKLKTQLHVVKKMINDLEKF